MTNRTTTTLYKFRGSDQIDRILDILLNKKLYCADYESLNDPREGYYWAGRDLTPNQQAAFDKAVAEAYCIKKSLRVCSLSGSISSPLLWAHYASDFKGVAIEVQLPSDKLAEVDYKPQIEFTNDDLINDKHEVAKAALSTKRGDWEYEDEWRLLHKDKFYHFDEGQTEPSGKVTALVLGCRMSDEHKNMWHDICEPLRIPIKLTDVNAVGQVKFLDPNIV